MTAVAVERYALIRLDPFLEYPLFGTSDRAVSTPIFLICDFSFKRLTQKNKLKTRNRMQLRQRNFIARFFSK
jgi:hypothetical protein